MKYLHTTQFYTRGAVTGLLVAFIIFTLKELVAEPVWFLGGMAVIFLAVLLAQKTAHHFHHHHTHAGDSSFDIVAIVVLFLANTFHPAVDGFSIYEVFEGGGAVAGGVFLGGVVLHEIFRQGALITAFKSMGVRWFWVVITAFAGIGIGIGTGFLGTHFFHEHEGVIDLVTLFAYVFIVSEFYFADHHKEVKGTSWFVILGLVIGTTLSLFFKAH